MMRANLFNLLCRLEDNYNKIWRAYRKDYGRKDAVARRVKNQMNDPTNTCVLSDEELDRHYTELQNEFKLDTKEIETILHEDEDEEE